MRCRQQGRASGLTKVWSLLICLQMKARAHTSSLHVTKSSTLSAYAPSQLCLKSKCEGLTVIW